MEILDIIKTIGMVLLGGLSIYLQYNKSLQKKIKEITVNAVMLIKKAEEIYKDSTKAGGEKFDYVVDQLYNMVPAPFNRIITKEMITDIVQSIFDEMESYAKEQLDKATNRLDKKD